MDYTPAYQYGDVRFITESDLPLHRDSTVAKNWLMDVLKFAKEFDVETDYIVLTGQPLAIYMVGALLAGLDKCPKILVWRREQGQYVVFDPLQTFEAAAREVQVV